MQVWADYLDRLKAGEEPEETVAKPPETLAFGAHADRLP